MARRYSSGDRDWKMLLPWKNDTTQLQTRCTRQVIETGRCYYRVQEMCESRGGRPELSVLASLMVSVDVKLY